MNNRVVQNSTPLGARHSNWPREFKAIGLDPVLLGHTSTPQDPRAYHPKDPIMKQTHSALSDFSPLFKSDLHDTSPKAWAAWLEFTHGYAHPGVNELYSGYTPAGSPGGPWLAGSQLKDDGSAFYNKEHSDSAFMCLKAKEFIRTRDSVDGPWSLHLSLWRPHPPWVCAASDPSLPFPVCYRCRNLGGQTVPELLCHTSHTALATLQAPYHAMFDPDKLTPFVRAESAEAEAGLHPWLSWDGANANLPVLRDGYSDDELRKMRSQCESFMRAPMCLSAVVGWSCVTHGRTRQLPPQISAAWLRWTSSWASSSTI
jgi:hypothetical protein